MECIIIVAAAAVWCGQTVQLYVFIGVGSPAYEQNYYEVNVLTFTFKDVKFTVDLLIKAKGFNLIVTISFLIECAGVQNPSEVLPN